MLESILQKSVHMYDYYNLYIHYFYYYYNHLVNNIITVG